MPSEYMKIPSSVKISVEADQEKSREIKENQGKSKETQTKHQIKQLFN